MFSPWFVVLSLAVCEYFENGIVEGKGVWNELRVSFRISALISTKHTKAHISVGIWHSLSLSSVVVQKC